ncbi:MAG: chromophore lyase CpcT/CpeT [Pseudomonadota bacterium]
MLKKVVFLLGVLGPVTGLCQGPSMEQVLEKDLALLMQWFPGEYDNQEQVYFQQELEVPEDHRHERTHHIFYKADLPSFGDHVLYVQQYLDDDPDKIYRQRIYALKADHDENAVRLTIHTPKDVKALVNAHLEPKKLEGLTPEDTTTLSGCDVFWKRQSNQFVGYMKEDACTFESRRSGKTIIINDDLVLTESELWISDRARDTDGNRVFGHPTGIPHKNRKARPFSCWIAVKHQEGEGWYFQRGVKLHDQGGRFWVTTDEASPQTVGLKMRNVVWPYGNNQPSLVVYAYNEGSDRAVSYAWSEPTAKRVGLNLRWMQASCSAE